MPEHTTFFSYLIAMFPALGHNLAGLGHSLFGRPVTAHGLEPVASSLFVMVLLLVMAFAVRGQLANVDRSVVPESELTLRTFFEVYIGYWYDTMKDMMGPKRAKRYFPLVGSLACFILFSNAMGLLPGFAPPTSSWNITMGCALVVFVMFNYYGLKENGLGYIKHLFGPYLGPAFIPVNLLLFVIEVISTCIRPITLSVRLMLNMSVDHLLTSIILGMVALFLPLPIMVLGALVVVVQVVVFCLLTSIYISLATEHEDHGEHAPAHGPADHAGHAHGAEAHAAH